MQKTSRRSFLRQSVTAGIALALPRAIRAAGPTTRVLGANEAVRLGVVGLGDVKATGGVGGRGHQLIGSLRKIPGFRIAALCDVDQAFLDRESRPLKDQGHEVATHTDLRRLFDDSTIDAVVVATPNHWHALATVWACQAGKDVYVEKPFSYNLWEGRQMVAAARKYGRMVQIGTQNRSSGLLRRAFEYVQSGEVGPIRCVHTLVYRPRDGIGTVTAPTPPSATVDYGLWCGPSPKTPLMRRQLHYEWHWFWATGNGEIGNNGIHVMDLARWALGQNGPPPRALSFGGRFAFHDAGETPNTHIAILDYRPAPLICEVRNVRLGQRADGIGKFRNRTGGLVIDCAGGYFAGDATGGAVYDPQGKKLKDFPDEGESKGLEVAHLSSFLKAVRSRKTSDLAAEALEGHRSTTCCHLANISYRLGAQSRPEAIQEAIRSRPELLDAFERCQEYLRQNGVDLGTTPAILGPWVSFDARQERFTHDFAGPANEYLQREYRAPFVVPELA